MSRTWAEIPTAEAAVALLSGPLGIRETLGMCRLVHLMTSPLGAGMSCGAASGALTSASSATCAWQLKFLALCAWQMYVPYSFSTLRSLKISMLECMSLDFLSWVKTHCRHHAFKPDMYRHGASCTFVVLDYIDLHSLVVYWNYACVACVAWGSEGPVLAKAADCILDMLATFAGSFGRGQMHRDRLAVYW